MPRIVPVAVVCCALVACRTPERTQPPAPMPLAVLPTHFIGGRVPIAPVRIGDSPQLAFIVDTGADSEIVDATWAKKLGLAVENPQAVNEPGGAVQEGLVHGAALKLGGATFATPTMISAPVAPLGTVIGRPLDGLIGHTLLRQYVVEIDNERGAISFFDPTTYRYPGSGAEIPLEISDIDAYVHATLIQEGSPPVDAKLELDTGSFDALGLSDAFVQQHQLAPASRPKVELTGVGFGGDTSGYRTRLDHLELGPFRFEQLPMGATRASPGSEPLAYAGTIGDEILRRFKITLDYPHRRMFLEKNAQFDAPFEVEGSGLMFRAQGPNLDELAVHSIIASSPAAKAGLEVGDVLTELDGQKVTGTSLEDVWRAMMKPGISHSLVVKRGTASIPLQLTTVRLF